MTFCTPFTCTEIIPHMKILKYFALASKISVGAEDKSQNPFILWVKIGTVFQTHVSASFLVLIRLLPTLFLLLYVSFSLCLP